MYNTNCISNLHNTYFKSEHNIVLKWVKGLNIKSLYLMWCLVCVCFIWEIFSVFQFYWIIKIFGTLCNFFFQFHCLSYYLFSISIFFFFPELPVAFCLREMAGFHVTCLSSLGRQGIYIADGIKLVFEAQIRRMIMVYEVVGSALQLVYRLKPARVLICALIMYLKRVVSCIHDY